MVATLDASRLQLLAKLPLLLNSSLEVSRVLQVALREFSSALDAEAATIFILDESADSLTFWYSEGSQGDSLRNRQMPASRGIVGWVIEHQESVLTNDATSDSRFYSDVDRTTGFETRSVLCAPLTSRGSRKIGAIQALNCSNPLGFGDADLEFADQFSHHLALAMENATLVEQLRLERSRLETLERRKSEMMTVITHEIRTPLSLISTSSAAIMSGQIPAESVQKMQGILQKGLDRLTKLVSELRNLSLLTTGAMSLESSTIDPVDLIRQEAAAISDSVTARSLKLIVDVPGKAPSVTADEALIRIVIRNLLSNAIRFTANGGTITIKLTSELGLVRIAITDTGIGIPESELPLIFEKFYEVGLAMHHSSGDFGFKSGGLGIGLSTAKAILAAHSSTISVTSTEGKGSTFSFALPV